MIKYYLEVTSIYNGHLQLRLFSGDEVIMCKEMIYSITNNVLSFNNNPYNSDNMDCFINCLQNNKSCIFHFSLNDEDTEYFEYSHITETMTFHTSNSLSSTKINCNIDRDTNTFSQFCMEFEKINTFVKNKLLAE